MPVSKKSEAIAWRALLDVAFWLKFNGADAYLDALPKLRERIFDRAKEG